MTEEKNMRETLNIAPLASHVTEIVLGGFGNLHLAQLMRHASGWAAARAARDAVAGD